MKKFAIAFAVAAALSAAPAFAQTMDGAYGNTVHVTNAEGQSIDYHFDADNTFMAMTADGAHFAGAYTIADGQICMTPTDGAQACTEFVGDHVVGDTWTQTGTDGQQITVTITEGR